MPTIYQALGIVQGIEGNNGEQRNREKKAKIQS